MSVLSPLTTLTGWVEWDGRMAFKKLEGRQTLGVSALNAWVQRFSTIERENKTRKTGVWLTTTSGRVGFGGKLTGGLGREWGPDWGVTVICLGHDHDSDDSPW